MKLLKKFKIAVIVTVVICLAATLLGMRVSVSKQAAKLEKVFQNNNDGSGKGLGQYLKQIDESAHNLIQLAKQEGVAVDELSAARDSYAKSKTYGELYEAYLSLCSAADRLEAELRTKELSEQSREMLQKYYVNGIKDQKDKLSHMAIDFNEAVEDYNKIFKGFPLNVFRYLIGVKEAELFS